MASLEDNRKAKVHILIYPYAAQGHVTPMMRLARMLAQRNIMITFVVTDHILARLLASGIALPKNIHLVGLSDGLPEDHARTSNIPELSKALVKLAEPFAKLVEQLNEENPVAPVSCIISDIIHSHTQDLANRLGIPRVAFWTPSACAICLYLHAPLLVEKGIIPLLQDPGEDELLICIPDFEPLPLKVVPKFLVEKGSVLRGMLMEHGQRSLEAAWLLINTFPELEASALNCISKMVRTMPIGPLLPSAFLPADSPDFEDHHYTSSIWPEDGNCLNWLEEQKPCSVLYISFGSIVSLSAAQFQHLATGLEASKQPFLWVLREDHSDDEISEFLAGFKKRTQKAGFFTSWVPQVQVLCHKSVGGFLTHNGWNSTMESICAGKPMLCWPGFADQLVNAFYVTQVWKVGLDFKKENDGLVNRVEVERAVQTLMGEEGDHIRRSAMELRDTAMKSRFVLITGVQTLSKGFKKIFF